VIIPVRPAVRTFCELPLAVILEGVEADRRKWDGPLGVLGLGLHELASADDPLESLDHLQRPGF
jgi:hypothetical protein